MAEITAAMIKELRERTGVGMSKCKDALARAEGGMDKAIEILRKEGMASAVKKEGREAKDGFVSLVQNNDAIALVEVNCETDFVANNESFKVFIEDLATQIVQNEPASLEEFFGQKYLADDSMTVDEARNILIQKFGENIQIRRMEVIPKRKNASYGIYSHMGGKIVTVIEVEGSANATEIAYEVAMHAAAEAPEYLNPTEIAPAVIAKEKEIAASQVQNKPDNIKHKIVEGKLNAFYDEICLLNQKYVKDNSVTVKQFVEVAGAKLGVSLAVSRFWYWKVGQSLA